VSSFHFMVACRHENGDPVLSIPVRDYRGTIHQKVIENPPRDMTPFYILAVLLLLGLVFTQLLGRVALVVLLYLLQHHWRQHKTDIQKWGHTFYCADCGFTFEKQFYRGEETSQVHDKGF